MSENNFQWSDLGDLDAGRATLGGLMPVKLYRLMEYTPVSYTHLDVYKRQVKVRSVPGKGTRVTMTKRLGGR